MSISNSCSHVKSISIYIHNAVCYMFDQVASSNPRTACACQFVSVISQVASSNPRTTCACQFVSVISQVASSHPRTACACQFVSVISQVASSKPRTACAYLPVSILGQVPSSSQKNNLYLSVCCLFPQWTLLFAILLMSTNPAMDTTYPVVCYLVNVYQSLNGYDILC